MICFQLDFLNFKNSSLWSSNSSKFHENLTDRSILFANKNGHHRKFDTKKLCEEMVNPIAFFAFLTTISQFINILGDDIGFEEKTRMPYMLCWGGSPHYQRANNRCKHITSRSTRSFFQEVYDSCNCYFCLIAKLV